MQQTGEYRIDAPRQTVWEALNDPDVLARCIDGCEALNKVAEDRYQADIRARVGPVRSTFRADIDISDVHAPERYRLNGHVQGGAAGFGKGTADVRLVEQNGGTRLSYEINGSVGGKLAQVGNRLIDGTLRKMGDDFFARFGEIVAPGGAERVPPPTQAPATSHAAGHAAGPATESERYEPSGQWRIWLIVAMVLAASVFAAMAL